jgi:outer membrane protein OmpA-like peptidoglycan-associated protein
MSLLPPAKSAPSDSISGADPACRVNNVVPTSAVFAAALERLNRSSTISLFQRLTQEIDEHCRTLGGAAVGVGIPAGGRPGEDGGARTELLALLALLRETTEQHRSEIALIQKQLSDVQALSTRSQEEFEAQVRALFNRHIEQSLSPALTTASARIEQNVSTVFERDLKQIESRLAKEIAAHPKRRGWLVPTLLALLLGALCLLIGLLLGRRSFSTPCPAVNCCAGGADGRGGLSSAAGAGAAIVAPMGFQAPDHPRSKESEINLGSGAASAASDGGGLRGSAASEVGSPRGAAGPDEGKSKGASTADSAHTPLVAVSVSAVSPAGSQKEFADLTFAPGSMEAELLRFLKEPGARKTRSFLMDRLRFASGSHEVNPEGKEQVWALAQILGSHPSALIEIRGHIDGMEGEVYKGPDQHPGMGLSQIRAECVLKRLQFQKVPSWRMRIQGMGAARPVADNKSEEGRQRNRRVEIVVTRR